MKELNNDITLEDLLNDISELFDFKFICFLIVDNKTYIIDSDDDLDGLHYEMYSRIVKKGFYEKRKDGYYIEIFLK
mgnify:CR=1 FL=1